MKAKYIVPEAVLNTAWDQPVKMPFNDDMYRIPVKWLEANAKRFHVTNQQIIDAAITLDEMDKQRHRYTICGVYFLLDEDRIIYVGMSTNIRWRAKQHLDVAFVPFNRIAWVEAPDMYIRDIESYYIDRIQPHFNLDRKARGYYMKSGAALDQLKPPFHPYINQ
jgi:hypothetical protein